MWELDYKESWALKNWCFSTVMLEKTLESPLDCKEIQPVHPEGNQSWIFIGRTDAEVETPILWPHDAKNWFIGKDPMLEKIEGGGEEKGTTEDAMVGWHHWLNGHEFWVNSVSWWWTGRPGVLQSMGLQSQTPLSNWTELSLSGASCSDNRQGHLSQILKNPYQENNITRWDPQRGMAKSSASFHNIPHCLFTDWIVVVEDRVFAALGGG